MLDIARDAAVVVAPLHAAPGAPGAGGGRWAREHQRVRRAKARHAGGKDVLSMKLHCQIDQHNEDDAVRADDAIPKPAVDRDVVRGQGRWKSMTATAALRCIFSGPEETALAVSRRFRGVSSGHVTDITHMGAQLLWECAKKSMEEQILRSSAKHEYVVVQYMFDETSLHLQASNEQPMELSCLDMHGRVAWRSPGMASPCCEELIGRPCVLDDKTAACMAHAIEKHFPLDIYVPSGVAEWVGLCPGGDAAKASS